MDFPIAHGMRLLWQAVDDKTEERAWLYYCTTLPYQDKKNKMTFDQLMAKLRRPKISTERKMTDEQAARFEQIMKARMEKKK